MKINAKNEKQNKAPAYTASAGRIRACVWESGEAASLRHKITVSRLFQEENGSWQRGRTYYASELPTVVEAVSKAQQWIQTRQRQLESVKEPAQRHN